MLLKNSVLKPILLGALTLPTSFFIYAQEPVSNSVERTLLQHGIEQYRAGLYLQAASSLTSYLDTRFLPTQHSEKLEANFDYRQATYYNVLSQLKGQVYGAATLAENYIAHTADPVYLQRASFALAQYYFKANAFDKAMVYYEKAGIENLNNDEISDAKFELAYCYFYNNNLAASKNLFAAIKDITQHKYYVPGNYYYGLLAYNEKNYKGALRSFEAIAEHPEYKDVVPYYLAEIHYFLGNKAQLKTLTDSYLKKDEPLVYKKEMHLLRAQSNFESQKYKEALPDFEYYIQRSEKVRKEVFYELGYAYYKLQKWPEAIATFKELSLAQDSLGQTAMYLLGDCYLRLSDKKGARNAFGLAAEMPYNTSIAEASTFLYAKLSYELGNELIATRKFNDYIVQYPEGNNINEAKTLLSNLLLKSSNYEEAYNIVSGSTLKDNTMKGIYQKVAIGRGLQLMMDKEYNKAEDVFTKAMQYSIHKEFEAIGNFWLAELKYNQGSYADAVANAKAFLNNKTHVDIAKKISPKATVANAQMILGYAQMELGAYDEAQSAFYQVQKQSDNSANHKIATLRAADAAFMKKDYSAADKLYAKAIAQNVSEKDYAIYQRAILAGLNENEEDKRQLLNQLKNGTNNTYKEAAQLELAGMQIQSRQYQDAIVSLKAILNSSQNPQVTSNAMYKLAFAHQELGQQDASIKVYKEFIEKYPTSADRAIAIEALRLLYIEKNDFDGYKQYATSQQLPELDELTNQQSYFDELENAFTKQNWNFVITKANAFIQKYPESQYLTSVRYYRAEANRILQQPDKALEDYQLVIDGGWNAYAEDATYKAAAITYNNKDYNASKTFYTLLSEQTQFDSYKKDAAIGLMKVNNELGLHAEASVFANQVLLLKEIDKSDEGLANLILAKAAIEGQDYNEAILKLNKVSTQQLGSITAEAKYLSAYILKRQQKLEEAVKTAEKAAKTSSQYQYWVAKNFLLIADIMLQENDFFEANAIIEELKKGVKEPRLTAEINALDEKIKAAQKANSKVE